MSALQALSCHQALSSYLHVQTWPCALRQRLHVQPDVRRLGIAQTSIILSNSIGRLRLVSHFKSGSSPPLALQLALPFMPLSCSSCSFWPCLYLASLLALALAPCDLSCRSCLALPALWLASYALSSDIFSGSLASFLTAFFFFFLSSDSSSSSASNLPCLILLAFRPWLLWPCLAFFFFLADGLLATSSGLALTRSSSSGRLALAFWIWALTSLQSGPGFWLLGLGIVVIFRRRHRQHLLAARPVNQQPCAVFNFFINSASLISQPILFNLPPALQQQQQRSAAILLRSGRTTSSSGQVQSSFNQPTYQHSSQLLIKSILPNSTCQRSSSCNLASQPAAPCLLAIFVSLVRLALPSTFASWPTSSLRQVSSSAFGHQDLFRSLLQSQSSCLLCSCLVFKRLAQQPAPARRAPDLQLALTSSSAFWVNLDHRVTSAFLQNRLLRSGSPGFFTFWHLTSGPSIICASDVQDLGQPCQFTCSGSASNFKPVLLISCARRQQLGLLLSCLGSSSSGLAFKIKTLPLLVKQQQLLASNAATRPAPILQQLAQQQSTYNLTSTYQRLAL